MLNHNYTHRHTILFAIKENKNKIYDSCFYIGIAMLILSFLPNIILRGNAYVGVHDQLDGEVLAYIFSAKYLFQGYIPEFMSGQFSTALTPPSPGTVLFYILFPPLLAFFVNYFFVMIIAYIGMFLCLQEIFDVPFISCVVSFTFAILPFFSVYGLSVMGQPLLLYGCICLYKRKNVKLGFIFIILFSCFSSLVLVGYANATIMVGFTLYLIIKGSPAKKNYIIATCLLISIYTLFNFSLLSNILFRSSYVSHKTEIVGTPIPFINTFFNTLIQGMYHSKSQHSAILIFAIFVTIVVLLRYKLLDRQDKRYLFITSLLFVCAVFIAGFFSFWHCSPIVNLRNRIGGVLLWFQIDRFYWLYPCIWYLIFGFMIYFIRRPVITTSKMLLRAANIFLALCLLVSMLTNIYHNGAVKNINRLLNSPITEKSITSWEEFYSPDLFENIKEYIGRPQSDYRVASIGLHPSVSLYNGFYSIDGYSNNYDLEYKHEFRKIISKELEKSPSLTEYYDDWGSRCYLFVNEIHKEYMIDKYSSIILTDLNLNTSQLISMGCEYIFSAVPIESAYTPNLNLLNDFISENSRYHIYLYEVIQ